MIYFDDIDISVKPKGAVSATGVLAQSCSLEIKNSTRGVRGVGRIGSHGHSAHGPAEAAMTINYLLETESEPFFEITRLLKKPSTFQALEYNPDGSLDSRRSQTTRISFAGITGDYYLSNYSIRALPNQTLQGNATFNCFNLVSGKNAGHFSRDTSTIQYNTTKSTTHGWTTYLIESGNHPKKNPTFELTYSFEARYMPLYTLNRQVPSQVDFVGGEEIMTVVKSDFYNAHASGISGQKTNLASTGTFSGDLTIAPVLLACNNDKPDSSLQINLSGSHITSTSVSASVADFPKTKITARRSY